MSFVQRQRNHRMGKEREWRIRHNRGVYQFREVSRSILMVLSIRSKVKEAWVLQSDRDEEGGVQSLEAIPIPRAKSAEVVEALRFRMAAVVANFYAGMNWVLEGDAQSIVRMLQGEYQVKGSLEVVISDLLQLIVYTLVSLILFLVHVIGWPML